MTVNNGSEARLLDKRHHASVLVCLKTALLGRVIDSE